VELNGIYLFVLSIEKRKQISVLNCFGMRVGDFATIVKANSLCILSKKDTKKLEKPTHYPNLKTIPLYPRRLFIGFKVGE